MFYVTKVVGNWSFVQIGAKESLKDAIDLASNDFENLFGSSEEEQKEKNSMLEQMVFGCGEHLYRNKNNNKVWEFCVDEFSYVITENEWATDENLS